MKALQVRIRKVKKSDIDRIIDIERSWQHLSHWSIDSYYRLLNEDGFTSSFVAEADEENGQVRIIGFVIFHVVNGVSEVYNIAVEARHARTGIGKQLMATVIEESRKRDVTKVMLEVRKSNVGAIRFYDSFQFRIVGERKNYYSSPIEDAFVMELALVSAY
jgi:ribosomal-protein-alanine N-acetyltransferase